ncbi:MAG TPA: FKBP-type peptidyl-prolyl cis-trans isomerase [Verrucomicrobiae bacterium]
MKIRIIILSAVVLAAPFARAEDAATFKDEKSKISYAIGMNLGANWKRNGLDSEQVSIDEITRGIKDSMAGGKLLLTEQEAQKTLNEFSQQMRAKADEKRKAEGEKNKKAGAAFLEENKTKPGVVTLPSGLQYKVLAEGKGESPKATDTVSVNYRGTLIDGTEFDSNAKRGGEPAKFGVSNVVKGWTEALQLMKPGAKWQLFIPAELAYGDFGRPPTIPPASTLIFEIELLSVQAPQPPPPSQPVTSDIIKVPSAEEMAKGAKIETIKAEDLKKIEEEQRKAAEKAAEKK